MSARMNACDRQRTWKRASLALLCGALMGASFAHPSLYVLCWIAFVPLLLALRDATVRQSYVSGVLAGLAMYVVGACWIVEFLMTLRGGRAAESVLIALLVWTYCAQLLGLVAASFTWLRRASSVPDVLLFALVVTALYAAFPTPVAVRLGESQSHFLPALQAVEFTGVYGLDFMIALGNAAVFAWITRAQASHRLTAPLLGCVFAAWFGYGVYALSAWDRTMAGWGERRIGIVQPNEAPSVDVPEPPPGFARAYPPEMALTEQLAAAGVEAVIWPETRFKAWFESEYVRGAFARRIAAVNTPVLFHDMHRVATPHGAREYNTAVFLGRDGALAGAYRKIKRIAFGEYLPLITDAPAVSAWVRRYLGRFLNEISRGGGPAVFDAGGVQFVPLICYEVMFPAFVARSLPAEPAGQVLAALSNDGWFGRSRLPYQHLHASVLRAVENRLTLVHVLNNGPSGVIAPNGRIVLQTRAHTQGAYIASFPYSSASGGSLFSKHPQAFIAAVYCVLAWLVARALFAALCRKAKASAPPERSCGPLPVRPGGSGRS